MSSGDALPTRSADAEKQKPIHGICLDAGPLIKNDPPVSTLLSQAHQLYTLSSILEEIRDTATRTRVETQLLPFVTLRNPRPASIKFVTDFARRTGDLEVMSRPDVHLLALTYELELEQNGGDWRLRKMPGQRGINGQTPSTEQQQTGTEEQTQTDAEAESSGPVEAPPPVDSDKKDGDQNAGGDADSTRMSEGMSQLNLDSTTIEQAAQESQEPPATADEGSEGSDSDSDDGWITPSNLKKHQAKDNKEVIPTAADQPLKVALLTSDYAMQNVALRIGLNLLSPSMSRITQVKNWVLRCHGCFQVCKKMDSQFCPKCGQPTLTRVSCTTADDGSFRIHLKRNFQWNNRGNVYSIPKPVTGTASGKLPYKGAGGKNGWGTKLILAEDQKEYERAQGEKRRQRQKDLMDEDYLPNILTGERSSGNGKIRLGPGRAVNGRKGRG
ncbi:hypothetical protein SODALDRAFT_332311 [Sodiomyces alkalinus F11]|uniref:20S-pre-rRNA D-site endonuclease NOB1 n=1 Tax=Sodiomyces alkalinus (strain CBS 110278 / VKM F-3762 / F11) TaxID=1314773 RepID=A0A3N2PWL3_SODAK|nr:hypothetical protein SODALDRAFT_332311 [Sodiomyces alkalinus F11]ROT38872.1 hypothetical protein SODALDRAFT_332311 [Sodiomyces alkalinus F11]